LTPTEVAAFVYWSLVTVDHAGPGLDGEAVTCSRSVFSQRFLKRQREDPAVSYVVMAVSASGCKMWAAPPRQKGHPAFGPRRDAEVFRTKAEAQAAIDKLPESFRQIGFNFEVESVT
jgi:hypothetical protein